LKISEQEDAVTLGMKHKHNATIADGGVKADPDRQLQHLETF